jgi:hypothetical protein
MAGFSFGAGRLVYLETQAIGGYSSDISEFITYSMSAMDVMQKPSIGFDILQRLSGKNSDWGLLAFQARLAYDQEGHDHIEPQLYNAYFKIKPGFADIWLGHDRPAFGISSYTDNHGALLQPMSTNGFTYDRDWGLGLYRDLSWGDAAISLTSGSGMSLYFKNNYLLSGRVSRGILSQNNYNIGLSGSYGKPLMTMGYHLMDDIPVKRYFLGVDAAWVLNNYENRMELIAGRSAERNIFGMSWRGIINLAEENRFKVELQPSYLDYPDHNELLVASGLSYLITGDLTLRGMYEYNNNSDESKIIFQMYWYRKIF